MANTFLTANQWLLAFPLDLGSTSAVLGPLRSSIAEKGAGSTIAGACSSRSFLCLSLSLSLSRITGCRKARVKAGAPWPCSDHHKPCVVCWALQT
jgi:hypothetical protein